MLDKTFFLKAFLASFLVTRWLTVAEAVDDVCIWCDNRKVNRFTNCLFIETMSNPEFGVLPSDILLDMKSSIFAASSNIRRSPDHMKMHIMNGALSGELAEIIASYYSATGQSLDVATAEMMQITGYCYQAAVGKSPGLFVDNIKRLVQDIIWEIKQYDSDYPVYGFVDSEDHYVQNRDNPDKSFPSDGISSDKSRVQQPQQVVESEEVLYDSPPPINKDYSKQSKLSSEQKTVATARSFPNKNSNGESPPNQNLDDQPPSPGMRQNYGTKLANRPPSGSDLSAPPFSNKNVNGKSLSREMPEFYENNPANPSPLSNKFFVPSLQNQRDRQPPSPEMPQANRTNPDNRSLPSAEPSALTFQNRDSNGESLSPEMQVFYEVRPSNTPRQGIKISAPAPNHYWVRSPARLQVYETKPANLPFSSSEFSGVLPNKGSEAKNTRSQISRTGVENPNSRNQYRQTDQDSFASSETAAAFNNQFNSHGVPDKSKIKNSVVTNENFYQNNPILEYENFNDAYPVQEDKQRVGYNDFAPSYKDLNIDPKRYGNFPVRTNDNSQLIFNAPSSNKYSDSNSQPGRNNLPHQPFSNSNEDEEPQPDPIYPRPSSSRDSSISGSSNGYDAQQYDRRQPHQPNTNFFAPTNIVPSEVPDITSGSDTGQQLDPDLQGDTSAMRESSSPTIDRNQFVNPRRNQGSSILYDGIKLQPIASESVRKPGKLKPASNKNTVRQQGVGNANKITKTCSTEFSDTLIAQLLESNAFHSIFGVETPPALAKQIASEALKRAFNDNGKAEYSEEVARYCSQQFESLSDVSSTEVYAKKISKSAKVILKRNDLLTENCENLATSMALDILRWLEVIADDVCLDSSTEETSGNADSSNSSPTAPVSSNSSPNTASDDEDTVQPGNKRDSGAGPTSTKPSHKYQPDDEYPDDESSESSVQENQKDEDSSEPSVQEDQRDEEYEQYGSEDDEDGSLNSSPGTSIIPKAPEESNSSSKRRGYEVIKESELSESESKKQIEVLMASAGDSISFNGIFDFEGFTTAMSSVAFDMHQAHSDWNPEKILLKTYLQAVVALTQVLQEIAMAIFSTQSP